jgi:hypothetical protein
MKIYISGSITNNENYIKQFGDAEFNLIQQGHEVVNPVNLSHDHNKSWSAYMKEDIKAMMDCDAIYMLKGWHHSRGAVIEKNLAYVVGMKVINDK